MKFRPIMFIAMICACVILITSCNEVVENSAQTDATSASENADSLVEKPSEISEETPYWKLQGRTVKSRADSYFDLGSNVDIALSFSKDWVLEKTADAASYDIKFGEKTIGKLFKGSLESNEWSVVDKYSRTLDPTLSVKKFIEKKDNEGKSDYRYRFEYNCTVNGATVLLSLCLDYLELDSNAADRLYKSAKLNSSTTVKNGMLSNIKDGKCLILGNSFISTSEIGALLDDMMAVNNKQISFNAVSRGYAQVGTYVADTSMMKSIESGTYDAVFICGFYANAEANNLVTLEKACKKSNTELIIFPAHNEFEDPIKTARNKCPTLKFLDWKGELDMLIESGVDKWELCYNDQHLHSTEYAGLIGAHMIYRAIYGEIPVLDGMSVINMTKAKALFGDYLTTGCVEQEYEAYKLD